MGNIELLTKKRENLLIQITGVKDDLREYIKFPCETVDVLQIKYQYGFILREIKEIDDRIKFIFACQSQTLNVDFELLKKQEKESLPKENFSVKDLPKQTFSMFSDSDKIINPDIF